MIELVTVRPATDADSLGAAAVVERVFRDFGFQWDPDEYAADLYHLGDAYLDSGDLIWVGEGKDGQIVAVGGVAFHEPVPGEFGVAKEYGDHIRLLGSDCELVRVYVHPDVRRQGLGRRLSLLAIQAAQARGCQLMEIWSDKRFVEAHRLYQSLGATVVGERICKDPDQSPEWGLALRLDRTFDSLDGAPRA